MPVVAHFAPGADDQLLIVCEHASNVVPPGFDLGVEAATLQTHIAIDIGAADLSLALGRLLDAPLHLATVSRLVADFNRAPDDPGLAPETSDGVAIPGNQGLDAARLAARVALHRRYHDNLAAVIAAARPALLISIHSFTPALATSREARPWPVGLLWNRDDRAARLGLAALAQEPDLGGPVGANQPYSGATLNYAMDRHAEANAIPYLGFEVRQDLIGDPAGAARWAQILARVVQRTRAGLP